ILSVWYVISLVQHYVCYVTGSHFKAILFPGMYGKPTMSKSLAHPLRVLGQRRTTQHNTHP
ncbi:hypothetical protein P3676_24290, partial [Vibrio parahaemolyticus]|nr:hypothetical protein [Vibrio parahaemolyticus]